MFDIDQHRIDAAIARLSPNSTDIAADFAAAAWTTLPDTFLERARDLREEHDARVAVATAIADNLRTPDEIIKRIERSANRGLLLLTRRSDAYPTGLDDLGRLRPEALWVAGRLDAVASLTRSIAIVGARASSGYGELVASQLAQGLASAGRTVVSGGAYGIDGTAHRATIAAGGTTVAVLAGGLDRYYPAGHQQLLERVADTGAVISESPIDAPPTRFRFLERNRLIAAMAAATVVVEAGGRSGSLSTAHLARGLGRIVGAVPGPVTSGTSTGCHELIREGALLVTRHEEIMSALA